MIHRITFLALALCSFAFVCAAPPAQERMLQANKLYEQGEFAKAYDLYKGIQYKSPEPLINMGNAAYQLGRYADTLVRWRQAQQQVKLRDFLVLEDRIEKIQKEHGGQFHANIFERIASTIDLYMRAIPHKIWQLLFLLLVALCFGIISWITHRKWGRLVSLLVLLLVVGALLMVRYTVQNRLMGFVMRDTHAYVTKDSQARIKASMASGQEIEIRAIHDKWYLVTDGIVTGWIAQNDIQLV